MMWSGPLSHGLVLHIRLTSLHLSPLGQNWYIYCLICLSVVCVLQSNHGLLIVICCQVIDAILGRSSFVQ